MIGGGLGGGGEGGGDGGGGDEANGGQAPLRGHPVPPINGGGACATDLGTSYQAHGWAGGEPHRAVDHACHRHDSASSIHCSNQGAHLAARCGARGARRRLLVQLCATDVSGMRCATAAGERARLLVEPVLCIAVAQLSHERHWKGERPGITTCGAG